MSATPTLALRLTPEWVERYCRELARRAPSVEKRIAALDALNTFLAAASGPGEQAGSAYRDIRSIIASHFEQARGVLLAQQGERLLQALRQQRLAQLTPLYGALSRDSFWQLLRQAEPQLEGAEHAAVVAWCRQWMGQAQQRAAAASPYPDTIDFAAAGLDVTDYMAMSDLHKFFAG